MKKKTRKLRGLPPPFSPYTAGGDVFLLQLFTHFSMPRKTSLRLDVTTVVSFCFQFYVRPRTYLISLAFNTVIIWTGSSRKGSSNMQFCLC